jgi:hypothetical protein
MRNVREQAYRVINEWAQRYRVNTFKKQLSFYEMAKECVLNDNYAAAYSSMRD